MMPTRLSAALTVSLAAVLICGCAPTKTVSEPPSPTATPTGTSTSSFPAGSTSPTPTCGPDDAGGALAEAVRRLPAPFQDPGMSDNRWAVQNSDAAGFDSCAVLSWVVVTVEGGTVSSPSQVALFHRGELLGPATERSYGFWPDVTRISDAEIEVAYRFPQGSESNAEASGRAVSRFVWDVQSQAVHRTGDLPPTS